MEVCPICQQPVGVISGRYAPHSDCPGTWALVDLALTDLESRYTLPRSDCPNPQWWHADDGDSTEREVTELVAALVRALQPEMVVETGTAWGQTAEAIGVVLQRNGHGQLHTLEPDPVRAEASRRRCADLPVQVHERKSLDFAPPGLVGFAWLDSLLELRTQEFRHLRPHLKAGAVVGFHDTGPQHGWPLRDEIERLAAEGLLRPMFLPTPRGVCFAEVLAENLYHGARGGAPE